MSTISTILAGITAATTQQSAIGSLISSLTGSSSSAAVQSIQAYLGSLQMHLVMKDWKSVANVAQSVQTMAASAGLTMIDLVAGELEQAANASVVNPQDVATMAGELASAVTSAASGQGLASSLSFVSSHIASTIAAKPTA
jgi:HPt (histidine-containing phosphotransfer) domain-containing protein